MVHYGHSGLVEDKYHSSNIIIDYTELENQRNRDYVEVINPDGRWEPIFLHTAEPDNRIADNINFAQRLNRKHKLMTRLKGVGYFALASVEIVGGVVIASSGGPVGIVGGVVLMGYGVDNAMNALDLIQGRSGQDTISVMHGLGEPALEAVGVPEKYTSVVIDGTEVAIAVGSVAKATPDIIKRAKSLKKPPQSLKQNNVEIVCEGETVAIFNADELFEAANTGGISTSIEGVGRGANRTLDLVADEVEGALRQADRVLRVGGTGNQRWGAIYQHYAGTGHWLERVSRGNALQAIANSRLGNSTIMQEAGVIFNQGSVLGKRSSKGALLRPDFQVPLSNGRVGILDITTPGQASKISKYSDDLSPYLINILY